MIQRPRQGRQRMTMKSVDTLLDVLHFADSNTAVIVPELGIQVTYDSLRKQVLAMANALASVGIRRGDSVACLLYTSIPGSIGYVEYQYAVKGNIPQASVLNPSGKFVKASAETIAAACQAAEAPRWNNFSASLTNVQGANSFPITSFTWVYLRIPSSDAGRTVALVDLLNWIYTDGQQSAVQEGYSALPPDLLAAVRKKVKSVQ